MRLIDFSSIGFSFCLLIFSSSVSGVQLEVAYPNLYFDRPVDLQHSPDYSDRIFVVTQEGIIYVFPNDPDVTQTSVFLDIEDRVDNSGNEMGLLGLAFHPEYTENGYFYVDYTAGGPRRTVIARYTVNPENPESADSESEFILMEINQPYTNHNGGQIQFGPESEDGNGNYLYIAMGDGGSAGDPQEHGQNLQSLLATLLRIDVDNPENGENYGIPDDNPFAGNTQGFQEEIYAWGLRNPWRFSFDPVTELLWVADVGQYEWEEIDIVESGLNYGWNTMEGSHCYDPPTDCDETGLEYPIWEYNQDAGDCSVTGGFVYRGNRLPDFYGKYIYGDYCSGRIWALQYTGGLPPINELFIETQHNISSFGIDENNEIYICSFDGRIYRFNYPPTAEDDFVVTQLNSSISIDVLSNDSDFDGDDFYISWVSEPDNGIADIQDNFILYTPDEGFSETDVFTYIITDDAGGEGSGDVNVYVDATPQPVLAYSPQSINSFLDFGETTSSSILLFNIGQEGSVLEFDLSVSPFQNPGGGPDGGGYFWADSDREPTLPVDWIDITGMGTQITFPGNDEAGNPLDFGFEFPFYNETYSQCIVNANGWVGFGDDNTEWENRDIPSPEAPRPAILGFWDDLNPVNDECNEYCSGEVYTHSNSERLVVWFDHVAHWWTDNEDSYYDFQIVLYPSGDIQINYAEIIGTHSATIGIQDGSGTVGLQVGYADDVYVHSELSVRFSSAPTDWISTSLNQGEIEQGSDESIDVDLSSIGLDDGIYLANILISSNGGDAEIPVSLSVPLPSITIMSPGEGENFDPGYREVQFELTDFEPGEEFYSSGHIQLLTNGSFTADYYTVDPITVANLLVGTNEIKLQLVDRNNEPIFPEISDTVNIIINSVEVLLRVTSVSPVSQFITAPVDGDITIDFDSAVDPSTINNSTIRIFGQWTGIMPGIFTMEEGNHRVRFTPANPFSAGEHITITVSKNVLSMDGDPLVHGFAWQFWTASGPGSLDLVEIDMFSTRLDGEEWIQTYGSYAGDLNGDGFHDYSVPNERADDVRVWLNDGEGNYNHSEFEIYPVPDNSRPSTNHGADFNNDGLLDFVVGNTLANTICIFIGDGLGAFLETVCYEADQSVRGISVMDLDADGISDVITTNRDGDNITILPNLGDGVFTTRIPIEVGGGRENSTACGDANEDGIMDLFVGTYESEEIILLLGDGFGGLIPASSVPLQGSAWMIVTGDVNGDSHIDVVSANSYTDEAAVIFGDGQGNLSMPTHYPVVGFPLDINLGDLDGDGDLDLVTSSLGIPHHHDDDRALLFSSLTSVDEDTGAWTIYENDGFGIFENPRTLYSQNRASCAALHDRDRDGDLDLTGIDEGSDDIYVFDNIGSDQAIFIDHLDSWNLIGLPLEVANPSYLTVFPDAMENTLFSYNGAYIPDSIMIAGEGYWLRFENSGTSAITGIPINELTLNLNEGWNLISGLTEEISIYSATDSDSIIIPGTLYGFDGSYFSTEMMIPGAGFWLRTYQDGEITLSGRTLGKKRPRDFNLKDKANTLNINGSELHFGLEFSEKERMSYSLPPKPPTGVFDVRFKDGWKLVKDFGEIEVTNPGDILTISYNIQIEANENMNWVLTSESGKQYILKNAGEITVPTEETFILEKITAIPISFAMHQNYPNPFNPVTTLKYDLPEQAFVSLSIYDMLGREIIQLINANQNAGFKSIRWDATDSFGKPVSAGVYLYQIKAGDLSPNSGQDFVQTRKMVLMK